MPKKNFSSSSAKFVLLEKSKQVSLVPSSVLTFQNNLHIPLNELSALFLARTGSKRAIIQGNISSLSCQKNQLFLHREVQCRYGIVFQHLSFKFMLGKCFHFKLLLILFFVSFHVFNTVIEHPSGNLNLAAGKQAGIYLQHLKYFPLNLR